MRTVIVCGVFPPEPVVSAKISVCLASQLVKQGYEVVVITAFPSRPTGKIYPGYKRRLFKREESPDGFTLIRCFSFFSSTSSMLCRCLENVSFGVTSSIAILFSQKPDVVYSNNWPVFATALNSLVCKLRKLPLVIHIQDIYPESLVLQGRMKKDHWLYKFLLRIDRWVSANVSDVIVLSKSFAERYMQVHSVPESKLHVIPNWVDRKSVQVMSMNTYRQEVGISEDSFVLVYGGNIGIAASVETLIEAMCDLNTKRDVVLIIAGSGSQLASCQKIASRVSNGRTIFHSPWAAEDTSKVLAAADVLVLPTQGSQSSASVPSKLLSYLLAARPVLACVLPECDTARMIKEAGCGWIVPPGDSTILARKIVELTFLPRQNIYKMGADGLDYALKNFTTEICCPEAIRIIEEANKRCAPY
jgi:glycosyltransferase involved in cell wall biosynthesis